MLDLHLRRQEARDNLHVTKGALFAGGGNRSLAVGLPISVQDIQEALSELVAAALWAPGVARRERTAARLGPFGHGVILAYVRRPIRP